MYGKTTLALLSAAAIGRVAAEAPETSGNPPNVVYKASIEDVFFADAVLPGMLQGHITAQAPKDGKGVKFDVHFENLPEEGGPFTYHLHKAAVPEDGNCTATLTHLDPYGAGAEVKCNKDAPETCEVGDLSGKHGSIEGQSYDSSYLDLYAATKEDDEGYFGDLSFVIHYENSTRLACANFVKHQEGGHNDTTSVHPTPGPTHSPTEPPTEDPTGEPTPPPEAGAAQMSMLSAPLMVLGAAAVAFGM